MKKRKEMLAAWEKIRMRPSEHCAGVFGLGVSGRAMAMHLKHAGYRVIGFEEGQSPYHSELEEAGIECAVGPVDNRHLNTVDVLFLSPGVDPRKALFASFFSQNKPICGELELFDAHETPTIAVTGTNGKSTTVALEAHLLHALGRKGFAGGNYGQPLIEWRDSGDDADVVVAELSSFQLETAYRFAAHVGVVLNVSPDHGDRYDSFEAYVDAKATLIRNLSDEGYAVLNADCSVVSEMANTSCAHVLWFGQHRESIPGPGLLIDGTKLVPVNDFSGLDEMNVESLNLQGAHNMQNAAAACLACAALFPNEKALSQKLETAMNSFEGLEHRMEFAGEFSGVDFYNDSKATNDHAAAVAVAAMCKPTLLLVGGVSKGGGYEHLVDALASGVKQVLAFGEARFEFAEAFKDKIKLDLYETLAETIEAACENAEPGEAVLLAPACSSFDEFTDYAQRGTFFKKQVQLLAGRRLGSGENDEIKS